MSVEPIANLAASTTGSIAQSAHDVHQRAHRVAPGRARTVADKGPADQAEGVSGAEGKEIGPHDHDADGRQYVQTRRARSESADDQHAHREETAPRTDPQPDRGSGVDVFA